METPELPDAPAALTDTERAVLVFEKSWWKYPGAKDSAIRDHFDMSATRYYQVLNELLERPEAAQAEPQVVARLRRLRDARRHQRQLPHGGRN